MSSEVQVLVVDDHPVVRSGLVALIATMPVCEVAGEASTGADAIRLAREVQPDVVIMDLDMPDVGGVEATRQIVAASPHIAVLVLTMLDDDDSLFAAMRAGARGYVVKGADPDEVVRAIEAVAAGEAIFSPAVADRLIKLFQPGATPPELFPELTEREREVLELIAAGDTNPLIARKLSIRPKTVRNHVSNVFTKLQVADRTAAVLRAREAGLGG